MSAKSKGQRREREAVSLAEQAGMWVETPNYTRYYNTDFWRLFDFMAVRPDRGILFVQVKSNRAAGIQGWADTVAAWFDLEKVDAQMWVCHDNAGWRVLDAQTDDVGGTYETVVDERDQSGNMGDQVREYLFPTPATERVNS